MLSKKNRATTHDIRETLGRRHTTRHGSHLSLRYSHEHIDAPLCSVVVSKRVARTAVARNALKRKLRAALKEIEHLLPRRTIIVYAKTTARDLSVREAATEILNLLA